MIAVDVTWLQRFLDSGTSVLNFKHDWPNWIGPVSCSVMGCMGVEGPEDEANGIVSEVVEIF